MASSLQACIQAALLSQALSPSLAPRQGRSPHLCPLKLHVPAATHIVTGAHSSDSAGAKGTGNRAAPGGKFQRSGAARKAKEGEQRVRHSHASLHCSRRIILSPSIGYMFLQFGRFPRVASSLYETCFSRMWAESLDGKTCIAHCKQIESCDADPISSALVAGESPASRGQSQPPKPAADNAEYHHDVSLSVPAPLQQVWELWTDLESAPKW